MKKLLFLFIVPFSIGLVFSSCQSENEKEQDDADSTTVEVIEETPQIDASTSYRIPSPVKLYVHMKNNGAHFISDAMNPPENMDKYVTTNKKAVNFGIYAADLAYSTVFEKNQSSLSYFKNVKMMAESLGLSEGFDEIMSKRIDKNEQNPDSIYEIASDAYYEACNYLEAQGKEELLSYILIGGWIESVHIAAKSIDEFDESNPIVNHIADQGLVLDNLINHLHTVNSDDSEMKKITQKLLEIQDEYNKLYENPEDVVITYDQYEVITEKITALRNELIS